MLRRINTRGSRKRTIKPKDKKISEIQTILKSLALICLIWLLVVANLIFIVSMIFQILNTTGGEQIVQTKAIGGQKVKSKQSMIKVEILNGCGVNKLAAQLRAYLIDKNYDVIDFKDYISYNIPTTFVIDRKHMDKRYAKRIAGVIGVKQKQVFPQLSPQRKLDVTIIIGKDYQDLKAFK